MPTDLLNSPRAQYLRHMQPWLYEESERAETNASDALSCFYEDPELIRITREYATAINKLTVARGVELNALILMEAGR